MKLHEKRKCKYCNQMAILIKDNCGLDTYYYHYSRDYNLGCHQRMGLNDKSLTTWTKDDEIRNLTELVRAERAGKNFFKEELDKLKPCWWCKLKRWLVESIIFINVFGVI